MGTRYKIMANFDENYRRVKAKKQMPEKRREQL